MSSLRTLLPLVACLAVAVLPVALADPPKPERDAARITRLIEQLGSESYRQREDAAHELMAIGEPAVRPLRRAMTSADAEVRRRATGLVQGMVNRRDVAALQGFWVLKTTEYLGERADQDPTEPDSKPPQWYVPSLAEYRYMEPEHDLGEYRTTIEFKGYCFERREWGSPGPHMKARVLSSSGTYRVDATRSPSLLTRYWEMSGMRVGLACRCCVYSVQGDTLRMCVNFANDPKTLPDRLATDIDEDVVLLTFKREKKS